MVAGQQGAQHASTIEISSTSSRSEDADDQSPRATPIPSHNHHTPGEKLADAQAQTEEDELDPGQPLADFDWTELEARYHGAMKERNAEEQELFNEFERLMNFFQMWANTTTFHETDRTFTRLRTRMAHVQHAEDQLEEKRGHYLKVVNAFESALRLLGS
ncbi:Zinc finger fyve domain-containing protein 19 [Neofusicoccum parvum]|uniref:Zinc finger fyve domain-containing protein 19 n=1 Tax=Neofusicoccum parvum TaxID=310453 RepID=A0ACB5SGS1_9PEZI|nr:Zinc finger fyve domain-containing protein 19 [Neofusicoccum parvum]